MEEVCVLHGNDQCSQINLSSIRLGLPVNTCTGGLRSIELSGAFIIIGVDQGLTDRQTGNRERERERLTEKETDRQTYKHRCIDRQINDIHADRGIDN